MGPVSPRYARDQGRQQWGQEHDKERRGGGGGGGGGGRRGGRRGGDGIGWRWRRGVFNSPGNPETKTSGFLGSGITPVELLPCGWAGVQAPCLSKPRDEKAPSGNSSRGCPCQRVKQENPAQDRSFKTRRWL